MAKNRKPYQKCGVDYRSPASMQTLPREYYQSEAIYREELEKIFCQRWLLACREEEILETGDYLTVSIGD